MSTTNALEPLPEAALRELLDLPSDEDIGWALGAVHPDPQVRLSVVAMAVGAPSDEAGRLLEWAVHDDCDEVSVAAIEGHLARPDLLAPVLDTLHDMARSESSREPLDPRVAAAQHVLAVAGVDNAPVGPAPVSGPPLVGARVRSEAEAAGMVGIEVPGRGEVYLDARPVSWDQVHRFIDDVGVTGGSWRPLGAPRADYTATLRLATTLRSQGRGHDAVTTMNWFDAAAYSAWRGCRLPRVEELHAGHEAGCLSGRDVLRGELTSSRRLDLVALNPFCGVDAYRDTTHEWTLEAAQYQPGRPVADLPGRHVLRIGGGVGFRCAHSATVDV